MRKKKKIILLIIASVFLCLLFWGYRAIYYADGRRRVDLRITWPKGDWTEAKFYAWESVIFEVPPDKIKEFEQRLREETKNSAEFYYIMLDDYQLRIDTTKGKYYARVRAQPDYLIAERWKSRKMRQILREWGMEKE